MSDIQIEDLCISFGNGNVVDHISTTFREGCITGLIGESGSGKSVLGMSIMGLLPSNAKQTGKILFENRDMLELTQKELRKIRGKKIGLIPQNPAASLNPSIKVRVQTEEAVRAGEKNRKAAKEKSKVLLQRFGFPKPELILEKYPFQLSGGMKQRVICSMGMACEPQWVIADEPTKGLDAALRGQVCDLLNEISKDESKSMLIITHDLVLAERSCQWLMVLYQGSILEEGKVHDVLNEPLHPYTQGLLNAQPSRGMKPLPPAAYGDSAGNGCVFLERCPRARKLCREKTPEVAALKDGRKVRCHYAFGSTASE